MKNQFKSKFKTEGKTDLEVLNLKNQLARALADYDNLSKRVERDQTSFAKIASIAMVVRLLPILDILNQAQEHLKDPGLAIAVKEFEEILKQEGIEKIEAEVGDKFTEELHEVVDTVEGEGEGTIAGVLLPGWKFIDGQVIRHAKVRVTSRSS